MSQQVRQHPRRKRKDREPSCPPAPKRNPAQHQLPAEPEPILPNTLLAGCMAYEFLTSGTLLGQKFDRRMGKPLAEAGDTGKYVEVAGLLRGEGAHIPGVINPSQLARWIKMSPVGFGFGFEKPTP